MKLAQLDAVFIHQTPGGHRVVDRLGEAQGIRFLCPVCFEKNSGKVGTHSIICWSPGVPADVRPGPGRWSLQGTGIDDLTLVAGSSSIALEGGCAAHFFVRNGEIVPC